MSQLIIDVYGISDAGLVKDVNEDSFVYKVADANGNTAGLFAVADGVGGLDEGDRASQTCIRRINRWWESELTRYSNGEGSIDVSGLKEAIMDSNDRILRSSDDRGQRSGTTLTMLATLNNSAVIAHVGDSRCYRLRKGLIWRFNRMTEDHSCERTRIVDGVPTVKTLLTDCIGFKQDFRLDISEVDINEGDIMMLCSDGIYKTQGDPIIEARIRHSRKDRDMRSVCEDLVEGAKRNKETDNISVIALSVSSYNG